METKHWFISGGLLLGLIAGYQAMNTDSSASAVAAAPLDEAARAKQKVVLTNGIILAHQWKSGVEDYFLQNRQMPNSNEEAQRISIDEQDHDGGLKHIQILPGGAIQATFDEDSGIDNGTVTMRAQSGAQGTLFWTCESATYEFVSDAFTACRYKS